MMKKDFDKWNKKKKAGENVGSEIGGKSDLFSRPVIIFKKLSHGFYFIVPTTTQKRKGSWYVDFRQQGKNMIACLQRARAIDHRRLSSMLGTLDDKDFLRIIDGFQALYLKRKFPAIAGRAAGKSRMY